jgi:hypothetical protein
MNPTVTRLELVTDLGNFTFKPHFNSTADFYEAAVNFESNNWKKLGEVTYKLFLGWPDNTETVKEFKGVNASADLSAVMESTDRALAA